jgi:hypothetical protein
MFSPFKFCEITEDSFLIGTDVNLAEELLEFFMQDKNKDLWLINTHRQTTTYALRNTQSIMLRKLKLSQKLGNTLEYNQVMEVEDSVLVERYPIFLHTIQRIEKIFLDAGVSQIEWGRIFFSKFLANSEIDEHTDEGEYFSYYDRFHFVIDTPDNCVFHIRNQDKYFQQGELCWVNNHVPHWLKNYGNSDRINLIVDARLK